MKHCHPVKMLEGKSSTGNSYYHSTEAGGRDILNKGANKSILFI